MSCMTPIVSCSLGLAGFGLAGGGGGGEGEQERTQSVVWGSQESRSY